MKIRRVLFLLSLASVATAFGEARAQLDQFSTIEQRIEQLSERTARPLEAGETILTGTEDIVLLREAKLFSLRVESSYAYTNNAFLSDNRKENDDIFSLSAFLRVATRIDQRYDVYAEIGVMGSRYASNDELDFDAFTGKLGFEAPVAGWLVGPSYSATQIHEKKFGNRLIKLHDISLSARRAFTLGKNTAVVPRLTASRVYASPDDFSNNSAKLRVLLLHRFSESLSFFLGPEASARYYDDFFEELTGQSRHDFGLSGLAMLVWSPADWFMLSGRVDNTKNWSTVDNNVYTGWTASPSVRLTLRF